MTVLISSSHSFWQLKPQKNPSQLTCVIKTSQRTKLFFPASSKPGRRSLLIVNVKDKDPVEQIPIRDNEEEEVNNVGVKAALSMLKFYKREISPLMPNSCRYVPTCSEYSMEAYKRYGVAKGTILTAWRLCRCNPLGGSGFDPPRWFDEGKIPPEQ